MSDPLPISFLAVSAITACLVAISIFLEPPLQLPRAVAEAPPPPLAGLHLLIVAPDGLDAAILHAIRQAMQAVVMANGWELHVEGDWVPVPGAAGGRELNVHLIGPHGLLPLGGEDVPGIAAILVAMDLAAPQQPQPRVAVNRRRRRSAVPAALATLFGFGGWLGLMYTRVGVDRRF